MILSGCAGKVIDNTDNTYRNALIGVKDEWLTYCDELGPRDGTDVGSLQQDFTALAYVAGDCAAGKRKLVDYLKPFVTKAKATDKK